MIDDIRLILPFKSLELVNSHDIMVNLGSPDQARKLIEKAFKTKGMKVKI